MCSIQVPGPAPPSAADTAADVEATVRELMKLAQVVEAGAGVPSGSLPLASPGYLSIHLAVPRLGEASPKLFGGQSTYNDLQVGCSRL